VGMSIGTAFGRIAGTQAAKAAKAAKNISKNSPETALAAAH
jgi:tricarballylate dehydrogenase